MSKMDEIRSFTPAKGIEDIEKIVEKLNKRKGRKGTKFWQGRWFSKFCKENKKLEASDSLFFINTLTEKFKQIRNGEELHGGLSLNTASQLSEHIKSMLSYYNPHKPGGLLLRIKRFIRQLFPFFHAKEKNTEEHSLQGKEFKENVSKRLKTLSTFLYVKYGIAMETSTQAKTIPLTTLLKEIQGKEKYEILSQIGRDVITKRSPVYVKEEEEEASITIGQWLEKQGLKTGSINNEEDRAKNAIEKVKEEIEKKDLELPDYSSMELDHLGDSPAEIAAALLLYTASQTTTNEISLSDPLHPLSSGACKVTLNLDNLSSHTKMSFFERTQAGKVSDYKDAYPAVAQIDFNFKSNDDTKRSLTNNTIMIKNY